MVLGIQSWNQLKGSESPVDLGAAMAGVPLASSLQGPSFTLTQVPFQVPFPGRTKDPGPENQLPSCSEMQTLEQTHPRGGITQCSPGTLEEQPNQLQKKIFKEKKILEA